MKKFTLLELLIVISIIALLISILMPSLSKAREKAKSTICKSNLYQMQKSYFQRMTKGIENKSVYKNGSGVLANFQTHDSMQLLGWGSWSKFIGESFTGKWSPTLPDSMICPSDTSTATYIRSYGMNYFYSNPNRNVRKYFTELKDPANIALFADSSHRAQRFFIDINYAAGVHHDGRANVVSFLGNVTMATHAQLVSVDQAPYYREP